MGKATQGSLENAGQMLHGKATHSGDGKCCPKLCLEKQPELNKEKKERKTISQTLLRESLCSRPVAVNIVTAVSIAVS